MRDYKTLFAICKKHGLEYKDVVAEFTDNHTESLKALTDGEFRELMLRLKRLNEPVRKSYVDNGGKFKPGDAQRKKIIAIARDMRWDVQGTKVMMKRIDDFMLNRTKYKKALNDLTLDELNKVCYTFEMDVKASFLTGFNR